MPDKACPIHRDECPLEDITVSNTRNKLGWLKSNWFQLIMAGTLLFSILNNANGWVFSKDNKDVKLQEQINTEIEVVREHVINDEIKFALKGEVKLQFDFITKQLDEIKDTLKTMKKER